MENVTEINNEVVATEVTAVENPVVETQNTEVTVGSETKSLAKDLGEMAVVGLVIYGFCKLVDFIVEAAKKGIKKFKENRAAKKAASQAQQAPAQGPVANVQKPAEGTTETAQQ